MAAEVWPAHWAPVQGDAILLAGHPKHVATELFAIIGMDAIHHAPDGPRRGDLVFGQPTLFRQDRVSQTQTDRQGAWRIEAHVKPRDHAAEDVNRQGNPGAANRAAMDI